MQWRNNSAWRLHTAPTRSGEAKHATLARDDPGEVASLPISGCEVRRPRRSSSLGVDRKQADLLGSLSLVV